MSWINSGRPPCHFVPNVMTGQDIQLLIEGVIVSG